MIGAAPLREIAEAVERAAKAEDLPTVRRLHEPLRREVLRVAEQAGVGGRSRLCYSFILDRSRAQRGEVE